MLRKTNVRPSGGVKLCSLKKKIQFLKPVASTGSCAEMNYRVQVRYTALCILLLGNIMSYARNKLKSKDEKEQCCIHSAVGALLDEKAVCDGIARGFLECFRQRTK